VQQIAHWPWEEHLEKVVCLDEDQPRPAVCSERLRQVACLVEEHMQQVAALAVACLEHLEQVVVGVYLEQECLQLAAVCSELYRL